MFIRHCSVLSTQDALKIHSLAQVHVQTHTHILYIAKACVHSSARHKHTNAEALLCSVMMALSGGSLLTNSL